MDIKFKDLPEKARKYIKEGIRKGFKFSTRSKYLQESRVELERITKKGKISLIPDVRYTCKECLMLYKPDEVQVDHVEPVVPIGTPEVEMFVGEYARRTYENNCQTLCKTCHRKKTNDENKKRLANRVRL